jgi:UDP-2,3-diacylglucosamine hydrolase
MNNADSETSPFCGAPPGSALQAPAHWRQIDFISDLHLQASEPATFQCWREFMHATQADAVFILGDLFEVWVGDDVIDPASTFFDSAAGFEASCGQVLLDTSRRLPVYFMHGNRDFLLGPAFAKACGMTLLNDPTVLDFANQRWLLSHGDALCLADTDYMNFRRLVRSPQWQSDFLSQPLAQRQETARNLRDRSEQLKRSVASYADLDTRACCDWLHSADATTLIHGHTHQPADHDLPDGLQRITLSDWDAAATPPRAEILRLTMPPPGTSQAQGTVQRLSAHHIRA